jgi:hypothetical protein
MINAGTDELRIVDELSLRDEITVVQEITIVPSRPLAPTAASRHVMALLADGVPLSLLCDLADPSGPPSADITSSETFHVTDSSGDGRSVLGDLLTFRAAAAEGAGRGASARRALRNLRLG